MFLCLTASQQRKSGAIIDFFARHTYDYLGLSPNEWTPDAVQECCTEVLPRKVSAELSFFEEIAPVLGAFFRFLEGESLLGKGNALAEAVEDLHEEIVASADDPSNWGPAKHFVMAAHKAGVDIHNPVAVHELAGKDLDPGWLGCQPFQEALGRIGASGGHCNNSSTMA